MRVVSTWSHTFSPSKNSYENASSIFLPLLSQSLDLNTAHPAKQLEEEKCSDKCLRHNSSNIYRSTNKRRAKKSWECSYYHRRKSNVYITDLHAMHYCLFLFATIRRIIIQMDAIETICCGT